MIIRLKNDDLEKSIRTTEDGYAELVNTEQGHKYFVRFLKTDEHEDLRFVVDEQDVDVISDEDVTHILYGP